MKILVINGPNINMLGIREPEIYGHKDYNYLCDLIKKHCEKSGVEVELFQSNHEGDIVDKIQSAYNAFDGLVINPAAYTHTSIAIPDAVRAIGIKAVEVHISDVNSREEFRKISYISPVVAKTVIGHGLDGYLEAIDYLVKEQ